MKAYFISMLSLGIGFMSISFNSSQKKTLGFILIQVIYWYIYARKTENMKFDIKYNFTYSRKKYQNLMLG
jgi:hypothetical protein